jgi:hypothetical protein
MSIDDEVEFLSWKRRTLELRTAFELRERDRLRAEVEAEEIRKEELSAELERAKAQVCGLIAEGKVRVN